ncbi:MAG TPA: hypothetical protein VGA70_02450 [Longimicrobiales bacterium]|jgi:hypothetical protein
MYRTLTPALLAAVLAFGCRGEDTSTTAPDLDREVFIATYVDLRDAVLDRTDTVLDADTRRQILERHGVTADDLLAFAEAHGADVGYMRRVWDEVEERLNPQEVAVPEDSLSGEAGR